MHKKNCSSNMPYLHVFLRKKDWLFDYLLGFQCWYHDLGQEKFQALKDISISTVKHAKIHHLWEETKISTMHVDFCSITLLEWNLDMRQTHSQSITIQHEYLWKAAKAVTVLFYTQHSTFMWEAGKPYVSFKTYLYFKSLKDRV